MTKIWIGIGIVFVIVIGYAIYRYKTKQGLPFLSDRISTSLWDTVGKFGSEVSSELHKELVSEQQETRVIEKETRTELQVETRETRETWCFVGEDLSGRFCVKVPSEQSCTRDRTFGSRSDCEMTPASHMPAGIITETGLLPLSAKS